MVLGLVVVGPGRFSAESSGCQACPIRVTGPSPGSLGLGAGRPY
jgi:hypothetical protein